MSVTNGTCLKRTVPNGGLAGMRKNNAILPAAPTKVIILA